MRPFLVLGHDQEKPEGFGIPQGSVEAPVLVPEPEPNAFPGSSRRDWVYRELSQLGLDATLSLDPEN